jgi:hypothetical protein
MWRRRPDLFFRPPASEPLGHPWPRREPQSVQLTHLSAQKIKKPPQGWLIYFWRIRSEAMQIKILRCF